MRTQLHPVPRFDRANLSDRARGFERLPRRTRTRILEFMQTVRIRIVETVEDETDDE